ncbi:dentin sialophosphoprotein-like isoform X3 [Argopecten irradians]|uniref:dentin sialophosphoprotein-like isoform X3 n=1 Tax=Argopecten irradians TaxID=31199 RepID=UPI00372218ED
MKGAQPRGSGSEQDPAEEKGDNQCKDEQETSEGTPQEPREPELPQPQDQHLPGTLKEDDTGSDTGEGRTDVVGEISTDSLVTDDINGSGPSESKSEPEEDIVCNLDSTDGVVQDKEEEEIVINDVENLGAVEKPRGEGFVDETNEAELFASIEEAEIVREVVSKKTEVHVTPVVRSYSLTEGGHLGLVAIDGEPVIPEPKPEEEIVNTVPLEGTSVDQIDFVEAEPEPEIKHERESTTFITESIDEGSSVDVAISEVINTTFDRNELNNETFDKDENDTDLDKPDVKESQSDIELSFSTEGGINSRDGLVSPKGVSEVITEVVSSKLETSVESDIKLQESKFSELNGGSEIVKSVQSIKMPEKTEQEVLAPALQSATCRYRWAKNLETSSPTVMFFSSLKMEEPVKLTWTEGSECFYSEEYEIPCGVYKGNLVVDGRTYPVEDITVKHYTFEVDLYVKDGIKPVEMIHTSILMSCDSLPDVIDDEGETDQPVSSPNDVDTYRDVNTDHSQYRGSNSRSDPVIHISNKYEELIRQQLTMTQSIDNLELEAKMSPKLDLQGEGDLSSTGRQSPLGDNAAETFQDSGPNLYNDGQIDAMKGSLDASVIEDEVERSSIPPSHHSSFNNRSAGSPSRQTPSNPYGVEDRRSPLKSEEPSLNGSGKHTPIDDVINNMFSEQRSGSVHSHTSSARQTPQEEAVIKDVFSRQMTPTRSLVQSYHGSDKQSPTFVGDVLGQSTPVAMSEHSGSQQGSARQTPVKSTHSSARQTPQPIEDVIGNTSQNVLNGSPAPGSYHGSVTGSPAPASYHGSATGSPAPASYHGSATGSPAPASYHGSATGSPAQASYHGSATGSPAQASYHGSATGSPAPASYHGSATGSPAPASYHGSTTGSPAPASYHGSATGSPAPVSYHGSATGSPAPASYHGSAAGSPAPGSYHGSLKGSQDQGSVHGSAAGSPRSYHGSQGSGSRPQSLTSEQELNQYFSDRSDPRRTPTAQQQQMTSVFPAGSGARPGSERDERSGSVSSLPVMSTQQRIQAEKRSMTPDNHIRVPSSPGVRMSPLVTGSGQRSGASSRSSTRTITPSSAANGYHVNGEQEDIHTRRIQELEDTVRNLRKLLGSREMEVKEMTVQASDLKEMNISLKEELELARNRAAPGSRGNLAEWERKYNQLMDEKEILAGEVVKLRDRLEESGQSENREGESMGLSNYSPNNPYALQRKIEELQSHVQDLQEANESAVAELSSVEKKCKELEAENGKLSSLKDTNLSDLQAENRRLHDKISTLWEQGYGDGDRRLRVEVQQFKDDNRALKERNYKLHEENLALREEVSQIRKVLEGASPKKDDSKLGYIDDRLTHSESKLRYDDDRLGQSDLSKLRFAEDRLSQSERLPPKEKLLSREELDLTYRRVLDKESEERPRTSYEKDDRFRRTLEKGEGLKSSLKKDDRFYRLEKEERYRSDKDTKYRSDREDYKLLNTSDGKSSHYKSSSHPDDSKYRYDPPLDKLTQYELSRSRSDRYDQDYTERSRSDGYRSRPDGSTSGEKDCIGLIRYDKQTSPEKQSYLDKTDQRERALKDSYSVEGQKYSTGQEYRSLATSYSELLKLTQQNSLGDKREWSRSEADLHAAHTRGRPEADHHVHSRGRSRDAPERRYSGSAPRGRTQSPPPSSRHQHVSRPRSAQLPRPVYGWDDELHRRTNSERSDSTAVLTAGYSRSDVGPPPPYRPKDSYDRRDTERDFIAARKSAYADEKGDESDTGTDILVNAQPFDKQMVSPSPQRSELHRRHHSSNHRRHRRRHDSLQSDGSDSSGDNIEEQITSLRRRSKSADGRELRKRSAPTGSMGRSHPPAPTKSGEKPNFSKTCPLTGAAGFRSVTPGAIPTQHNKNMLSASSRESVPFMHQTYYRSAKSAPNTTDNLLYDEAYIELLKSAFGCDHDKMPAPGSLVTLTTGLRPFAPRTPGDIHMEDVVKFSRQGGKLSQGTVKFVGHLPGRNDVYLGVELDKEEGKHDGTFESARYFKCKPNKGVFVAFNKVVMAWAP